MKILSIFFNVVVAGIVFSTAMSIYTEVQAVRMKNEPAPLTIPVPARTE